MESCGIGKVIAWRKRMFGAREDSVLVKFARVGAREWEEKQVTCPNGSTPLAYWVDQPVNAATYACRYICDSCYFDLFGEAPLPESYRFPKDDEVTDLAARKAADPLKFF